MTSKRELDAAYLDGLHEALKGRCKDLHSDEYNAQADEVVALFDQGRRDEAYDLWYYSSVMRESPAEPL